MQVAYTETAAPLTPGTTYYACAIAANSGGTAFGDVITFMPGAVAPTVTTTPATDVASTSATLTGTVNPNGSDSTAYFRYDTTQPTSCSDAFGTRVPATGGTDVPIGTTPVSVTQPVTGLTASTTYYFCAAATHAGGASFGTVLSFTTEVPGQLPPGVTTETPVLGTAGAATLNGTANPEGADATGWFRYSSTNPGMCDDTFGTRVPATGGQDLGSGTTAVSFSQSVSGLTAGTWYVCAIASNAAGTSLGQAVPLVYSPTPPRTASGGCSCNGGALGGESALLILVFARLLRRRRAMSASPL
jgi:hypothetical protein